MSLPSILSSLTHRVIWLLVSAMVLAAIAVLTALTARSDEPVNDSVGIIDGTAVAVTGPMRVEVVHGFPRTVLRSGSDVLVKSGTARLDLTRTSPLSFFEPDPVKFPCLRLARAALERGGTAPAVLNAANEVAVAVFLDRRIAFLDIPALIERALDRLPPAPLTSIAQCVDVDAEARRRVQEWVAARAGGSST